MINRRQFNIGLVAVAAGTGKLQAKLPATAAKYGTILAPEPPRITTGRQQGRGAIQLKTRPEVTVRDAWWTDKWIGIKANGTPDLGPIHFSDVRLERFGPMIVMRGSPDIVLDRIENLSGLPSSYGMGFLRATDRIGRLRANNLRFSGTKAIGNTNDAYAAICLWGKGKDDVCTDWEINRFDFRNLVMGKGKQYRNVDGISVEHGHDNGLIENGLIEHVSDAGIDCKGANCRINQVDIASARENLKIWDSSSRHGRIISRSPRFAHIIIAGDGRPEPIVFDRLECHGDPTRPVLVFEGAPRKVIIRTLIAPEGQILYRLNERARGSSLSINGSQVL